MQYIMNLCSLVSIDFSFAPGLHPQLPLFFRFWHIRLNTHSQCLFGRENLNNLLRVFIPLRWLSAQLHVKGHVGVVFNKRVITSLIVKLI